MLGKVFLTIINWVSFHDYYERIKGMNNKHYTKLEKIQNNMIFNRKLVWMVWSIWLFLNLSLLIIASRQTAEAGSRIACIYPFNYHMANTSLWAYDITEFIGYALVIPPVVAFLFQRFKRSEKDKFCQMMIFAFKTYIIYCFGFVVMTLPL